MTTNPTNPTDEPRVDGDPKDAKFHTEIRRLTRALTLANATLVQERQEAASRPTIPTDAEGSFGQRCEELGRIPAGRYYLTCGVEVGDNREVVSRFDIPGGVRIAGFWPSHKARIEPAPPVGSDTTAEFEDELRALRCRPAVPADARKAAIRLIAENQLRRYDEEFDASHLSWLDFEGSATADVDALTAAGLLAPVSRSDTTTGAQSVDAVITRMNEFVGKRVHMQMSPDADDGTLFGNSLAGVVAKVHANVWVYMNYGPGMCALAEGFAIREIPTPPVSSDGDTDTTAVPGER